MIIENGWCFYSADFSVRAMHGTGNGSVTFIRDAENRKLWHALPESTKENDVCPPLFVSGIGVDIESAILSANLSASIAMPVMDAPK